jgi:hypothetical protein
VEYTLAPCPVFRDQLTLQGVIAPVLDRQPHGALAYFR